MPKVSVTIFINTDYPKMFINMMKRVCWVFGGMDLCWGSPYSVTSDIEGEDECSL